MNEQEKAGAWSVILFLRQAPRRFLARADDVSGEGEVPAVVGDLEGLEQQQRCPERARVERVVRHLPPGLHPRLLHHLQGGQPRAISRAPGGRVATEETR